MKQLRLFFYSPGNLLGMGLACIGPLLLFTGVVDKVWWLASIGAYGVGFAAGLLFFPDAVIEQQAEMSLDDLQSFLERLLREHTKKLPSEAVAHLQSIHKSLTEALPRFKELFEQSGTAGREWLVFRQVILSYLPETLGNYLRLPATYAVVHKVGNTGKTPKLLLAEQLAVMDEELQKTVQMLFESDANKMLVASRFLEQKFEKATDFLV
jgi:hypothetical protein